MIKSFITIDLASSTSCSTASVNHLPQRSTTTPLIQSLTMEYSQQQSTNSVTIVSDTHTTTSPVTTLSVVECLTTSSSVVTSVSGQAVSAITTAIGMYVRTHNYMCVSLYIRMCMHVHIYIILYMPCICMYACMHACVMLQMNVQYS